MLQPKHAWLTGAFVVAGLALTVALLFSVSGPSWLRAGYPLTLALEAGNGLVVGTPVKFAGVEVGEVRAVGIARQAALPVEVELWVRQGVTLYEGDRAQIGLMGMLGERYIEITPGPTRGRPLGSGDRLTGERPVTEVELSQQVLRTLTEFETALKNLNAVQFDPAPYLQLKAEVERTLERAQQTLAQTEDTLFALEAAAGQAGPAVERWSAMGAEAERALQAARTWAPWVVLGVGALLALGLWL